MKKCKICKEIKEQVEFYQYSTYQDGMCKVCRNNYNKSYRQVKFSEQEYYQRLNLIKENKSICRICQKIKPLNQFIKSYRTRGGYNTACNTCRRLKYKVYHMKALYGVTSEQYEILYLKQKGLCAICKQDLSVKGITTCIDHNHSTGEVRGLLCNKCNRVLGMLNDNTTTLYSAIRYLKSAQYKLDELLETPVEDNQQPSLQNDIKVCKKVQRLMGEESTNNPNTSVQHLLVKVDDDIV